jgi:hypothetical protein
MKESNHEGRFPIHLSQEVDPARVEALERIPVKTEMIPKQNRRMANRNRKPTRRR